jgi:hypothetical protein
MVVPANGRRLLYAFAVVAIALVVWPALMFLRSSRLASSVSCRPRSSFSSAATEPTTWLSLSRCEAEGTSALSDEMEPSRRSEIAPLQGVEQILVPEPLSASAAFAVERFPTR